MDSNRTGADPAAAETAATRGRQYFEAKGDRAALGQTLDYDWVNEKDLESPGYLGLGPGPGENDVGFPHFVAAPRIVFKNKGKRRPLGFYAFDRIWIVSDRLKVILEEFDQQGFEFVQAETFYGGGSREGPSYWFCDVVRVLDCLDEAASTVEYYPNTRRYAFVVNAVMRPDAIGSAHVLRLRYYLGGWWSTTCSGA